MHQKYLQVRCQWARFKWRTTNRSTAGLSSGWNQFFKAMDPMRIRITTLWPEEATCINKSKPRQPLNAVWSSQSLAKGWLSPLIKNTSRAACEMAAITSGNSSLHNRINRINSNNIINYKGIWTITTIIIITPTTAICASAKIIELNVRLVVRGYHKIPSLSAVTQTIETPIIPSRPQSLCKHRAVIIKWTITIWKRRMIQRCQERPRWCCSRDTVITLIDTQLRAAQTRTPVATPTPKPPRPNPPATNHQLIKLQQLFLCANRAIRHLNTPNRCTNDSKT